MVFYGTRSATESNVPTSTAPPGIETEIGMLKTVCSARGSRPWRGHAATANGHHEGRPVEPVDDVTSRGSSSGSGRRPSIAAIRYRQDSFSYPVASVAQLEVNWGVAGPSIADSVQALLAASCGPAVRPGVDGSHDHDPHPRHAPAPVPGFLGSRVLRTLGSPPATGPAIVPGRRSGRLTGEASRSRSSDSPPNCAHTVHAGEPLASRYLSTSWQAVDFPAPSMPLTVIGSGAAPCGRLHQPASTGPGLARLKTVRAARLLTAAASAARYRGGLGKHSRLAEPDRRSAERARPRPPKPRLHEPSPSPALGGYERSVRGRGRRGPRSEGGSWLTSPGSDIYVAADTGVSP
jgi:hypothetical protein